MTFNRRVKDRVEKCAGRHVHGASSAAHLIRGDAEHNGRASEGDCGAVLEDSHSFFFVWNKVGHAYRPLENIGFC